LTRNGIDFIPLGKKDKGKISEPLAKLLKEEESCHSGQAKRDPESRIFRKFWIPAFAGMTEEMNFTRSSSYNCP
jgi:hypothetical protein